MEDFFELINKIPGSIYKTGHGILPEITRNYVENPECISALPEINGKADIVRIQTEIKEKCLCIERTADDPGEAAYYELGALGSLNGFEAGKTYTFSAEFWIPSDVDLEYVSIAVDDYVDESDQETVSTLASDTNQGLEQEAWGRLSVTKTIRQTAAYSINFRLVMSGSASEGKYFKVRNLQVNEGSSFPGFISGAWRTTRESSYIDRLFELFTSSFNELKAVIDDLAGLLDIDNMQRTVLDEIGKLLKEPRKNREDDDYKKALAVAIQRNLSSGSLESLSRIAFLLKEGRDNVEYNIIENETGSSANVLHPGTELLPDHQDYLTNVVYKLDGNDFLNPYTDWIPASFKVDFTGTGAGELDQQFISETFDKIRAAGVKAVINIGS